MRIARYYYELQKIPPEEIDIMEIYHIKIAYLETLNKKTQKINEKPNKNPVLLLFSC